MPGFYVKNLMFANGFVVLLILLCFSDRVSLCAVNVLGYCKCVMLYLVFVVILLGNKIYFIYFCEPNLNR